MESTRVSVLNLAENRIGREGCMGVSKLVKNSATLQKLNLDKCKVADSYVQLAEQPWRTG